MAPFLLVKVSVVNSASGSFMLQLCNWSMYLWQLCKWQRLLHFCRFSGVTFCYWYVSRILFFMVMGRNVFIMVHHMFLVNPHIDQNRWSCFVFPYFEFVSLIVIEILNPYDFLDLLKINIFQKSSIILLFKIMFNIIYF